MLTENTLLNIVQVWAEEALDVIPDFRGVKVIRSFEDGPEPMQARIEGIPTDGSSLFVTIDLTNDNVQPGWPMYCPSTCTDDTITRTRNMRREAVFSISAYRKNGVDAARHMIAHVRARQVHAELFLPHGVAFKEVSDVAVINEIVMEQWERRAQFTLTLSYIETIEECDPVMIPTIEVCEGEEIACEEKIQRKVDEVQSEPSGTAIFVDS